MKKVSLVLGLIFIAITTLIAQAPMLGGYPSTVVAQSGNIVIAPSAAPQNTSSITAVTAVGFNGIFQVNPSTGQVRVTNAYPAGNYVVTVRAANASSTATTTFNLVVNATCSQGIFDETAELNTVFDPRAAAVGDFNNDGKQDLIMSSSSFNNNNLTTLLGDGNGGFTTYASTFATVYSSNAIGVGDFNSDGNQDLAVINASTSVNIRLGNGAGGFSTSSGSYFVGNTAFAIVVRDFNGDGNLDFATANQSDNAVAVRLGTGLGTFTNSTTVAVGPGPIDIKSADFNGDGKADIAVVNGRTNGNFVSIRLGNGAGGFTGTTNIIVGSFPKSLTIADLNGDGKPDFATCNQNNISLRFGDGSGGFTGAGDITIGSNPNAITSGDFNGDGKSDLLLACNEVNGVYICLGNGLGGFYPPKNISVGANPSFITPGDFNNDGIQDFITLNANDFNFSIRLAKPDLADINVRGNNISIQNGDASPVTSDHTDFGTQLFRNYTIQNTGQAYLTVRDITISGTDATSFTKTGITLPAAIPPGGSTTFRVNLAPVTPGLKMAAINIYSDDCDEALYDYAIQGTGVVVSVGNYPNATVATAGGRATITPSNPPTNVAFISAVAPPGFKGLLQVSPSTGVVTVTNAHPAGVYPVTVKAITGASVVTANLLLTVNKADCGQGYFTAGTSFTTSANARAIATADFNGDGNQDFAIANYNTNTVSVRLGNGAGVFTESALVPVGTGPQAVAISDFNGDGNLDFASANYQNSTVSIRMGNGTGSFYGTFEVPVGSLPVGIYVSDFNSDGKADFVTADFNSGNVSIRLGDGAGNFTGTTVLNGGYASSAVAIADFNGDNKPDLAIINSVSPGSVSICLGTGTGGFSTAVMIAVSSAPYCIATADFNMDGRADIITADRYNSSAVSIRFGNGAGGFGPAMDISMGSNTESIAVGDFNGDRKPDFAIASSGSDSVLVRLGTGTGAFIATSSIATGDNPVSIIMGDFNNDGRQDMATANYGGSSVSILQGVVNDINITGNNVSITDGDISPTATDFTDLGSAVAGTYLPRNYSIQNTGAGTLTVTGITIGGADASLFSLGGINFPATVAAGAFVNFYVGFSPVATGLKTAGITIVSNDCDETVYDFAIQATGIPLPTLSNYPANITITAGGNTVAIPSAAPVGAVTLTATTTPDFKGLLQVNPLTGVVSVTNAHPAGIYTITVGVATAVTSFTLTVTNTNCSQGLFTGPVNLALANPVTGVAVADFNGDGKQDMAATNSSGNLVYIRLGDGAGGFSSATSVTVGTNPGSLIIGDFNGDGKQDFVTANNGGTISVRIGDGSGGFIVASDISLGMQPRQVISGDFNGDGKPDLAIANTFNNLISIRLGDGVGSFYGTTTIAAGVSPYSIVSSDFNGDNKQDIAFTNLSGGTVSFLLGNSTGTYGSSYAINTGGSPGSIAIADFNNDGKADFATANLYNSNVSIRMGNGTGNFSGTLAVAVGVNPTAIATGDFNGDGNQDFITTNQGSNTVSIRLGNGSGGFTGITNVAAGSGPSAIAIADFNNDGRQDFATANTYTNAVSIRLGNSNEINVQGNNTSITDGDSTVALTNYTDFGIVAAGASLTRSFTIQNMGLVNLSITNIVLSGTNSSLFAISGITSYPLTILPGGIRTFNIVFSTADIGLKTAAVHIISDDCDEGSYDFTIQGGTSTTGAALHFDGVDDAVNLGTSSGSFGKSDFTLQTWFKTNNASANATLISNRASCTDGNYWNLGMQSGKLVFEISENSSGLNAQTLQTPLLYNDSLWHQVSFFRKGSLLTLLVDGNLIVSGSTTDTTNLTVANPIIIGSSACGSFRGELDETRIWNRALSSCEIQLNKSCEIPATANGLLVNFHYNQGAGAGVNTSLTVLADSSGNENNGTLEHFALSGTTSNWIPAGAIASYASCSSNMWLGYTNSWNLPGNWSSGKVPLASTMVVINNCAAIMPVVTGTGNACYQLSVMPGATVMVAAGAELKITSGR